MNKKELFAIDIGSGKIRGAFANLDENKNINVTNICQVDFGGFYKGELIEPEKLQEQFSSVINNLVEATNKKIKRIVVGLPSQWCNVKIKKIDKIFDRPTLINENLISHILDRAKLEEKIDGARILHANKLYFCDENGKSIVSPLNKSEMQISMQISLCFAMEDFCTYIENCLSNLGVNKVDFIATPLAQAYSLFPQAMRDEGLVFMDNGFSSSFVASIKGDGLTSLTSFDLGGVHISQLLMNNLNLSYAQAQELKQNLILTIEPIELNVYESADSIYEAIPARQVNRYVRLEIQKVANMVKSIGPNIDSELVGNYTFYLTGNGIASIRGGKEILQEQLETDVEIVNSKLTNMESLSLSALASVVHYYFAENVDKGNFWTKITKFFKKY